MYPSIFNRFPVIQPVISKVRHFSTFLHILAFPGYTPATIAVNGTSMERGFNSGQTDCSMYPSIFNRLGAIARYWSEISTFSYPLAFNAQLGVIPLDDIRNFWWVSCRMAMLQYASMVEKYPRKVKPHE